MNFITRFATVAAFTVAANAVAEESVGNDARRMIARADLASAHAPIEALALDEYAGHYVAASGVEFIVVEEDNALTIDLPASFGVTTSRLRAEGTGDFFVASVPVLVSFDAAGGRVTSLTAYPPGGESPIKALKMPLRRGIVSIDDVYEHAASRAPATPALPRGIVTIHDVREEPQVAAAE